MLSANEKTELINTVSSPGWKHIREWATKRIDDHTENVMNHVMEGDFHLAVRHAIAVEVYEAFLVHFDSFGR